MSLAEVQVSESASLRVQVHMSAARPFSTDLWKKKVVRMFSPHTTVVMASGGTEELERPASFKSPVWENFGFPVKYNDEGKRLVDKTVTVCRHCGTRKPYEDCDEVKKKNIL